MKYIAKALLIFLGVFAALFSVWFFNLDMKLMRYVVLPLLGKHYDSRKIEHTL